MPNNFHKEEHALILQLKDDGNLLSQTTILVISKLSFFRKKLMNSATDLSIRSNSRSSIGTRNVQRVLIYFRYRLHNFHNSFIILTMGIDNHDIIFTNQVI